MWIVPAVRHRRALMGDRLAVRPLCSSHLLRALETFRALERVRGGLRNARAKGKRLGRRLRFLLPQRFGSYGAKA
jgi:hypothetical protein